MRILWGPVTEIIDLGVVAERCPYCEQTKACFVRAVWEVEYAFFIKTHSAVKETSCLCPICAASFPSLLWHYPELVPATEAAALPVAELLTRTNPLLVERIQFKQQIESLGGDACFTATYEQLEGMRPGQLHAELLKELMDWGRRTQEERTGLAQRIAECARAWKLARQVAPWFPRPGCLSTTLVAAAVWSALLWAPIGHSWPARIGIVVAGFAAAALASHVLLRRRIIRWIRLMLVPEAQLAKVSLSTLLHVVDDLSEKPATVLDDLWPVKDQLNTVRNILAHDGRL